MPGVKNAYEACVFTFGITQGGGAGKVAAEWIVDGQPEWDMWSCDPRRYTGYTDQAYCHAKAVETYGHEYAMHFPYHAWPAGRDKRLSPLHTKIKELGGVMGAYNGWERANWFSKPGDDLSEGSTQTWARTGPWQPRIAAECAAVRDHAGVIAISGFTRLAVEGPGARAHVDRLTASTLPKPGRVGLAYFPDDRGRILTEMSVIPRSDDDIWLITASVAEWHDRDVLLRDLPEGVHVHDRSAKYECLLVTGPKARDILAPLTDADLTLPWLSFQEATVCGKPCVLLRVSFAGELGWEVHCANDDAPAIYDAVLGGGAVPFGMFALNALRVEKGYRAWKGDLSTDYSLLEGGLDRFINFAKPDFVGKAALLAEKQRGVAKRFAALTLDDPGDYDAPYMSTIWHDGKVVGETTSSAWGYRTDKCIALAMLRPDLATEGTKVEIDIYGQRVAATVQADQPLWDPANTRIRA